MRKIRNIIVSILNYYYWVFKQPDTFKIGIFKTNKMKFYGFTPDQYTYYSLSSNSQDQYISEQKRWKTRDINGYYSIVLDDKLLFYDLFKEYINIPPNLFHIKKGTVIDSKGIRLDEIEIYNILKKQGKVYLKPTIGGGGKGIFSVEYSNKKWIVNNRKSTFETAYKKIIECNDFICNPAINQEGFSHEIFPKSVNTIRIVTGYSEESSRVDVLAALHRFGTKKSEPVDNASRGGVFSIIDIDTGKLGLVKNYDNEIFTHHPDTNNRITGKNIPGWEEIKKKCISVAQDFYYIPYMAWDIVMSENQMSVIEINASTDLQMFQMFGGVREEKLGKYLRNHDI